MLGFHDFFRYISSILASTVVKDALGFAKDSSEAAKNCRELVSTKQTPEPNPSMARKPIQLQQPAQKPPARKRVTYDFVFNVSVRRRVQKED